MQGTAVHEGAVIAVHGGAGPAIVAERAFPRRRAVVESLRAGLAVITAGGAALEAVAAAVELLEDHEEFNAGRGSVLTSSGTVEMDAAVADGASGRVGAVAAVEAIRHPVAAARAVLDDGRHVLLAGPSALDFARSRGLRLEAPEWFVTDYRRAELDRLAEDASAAGTAGGTVGAVALDRASHLAAATSTGGRAGKAPGRVGDSPVTGAGTWARDATAAVSATGDGEAFLLAAFAHEVDARLRLARHSLEDACRRALEAVAGAGGRGGCIALDRAGRLAAPFITEAMDRGFADASGAVWLASGPEPFTRAEDTTSRA